MSIHMRHQAHGRHFRHICNKITSFLVDLCGRWANPWPPDCRHRYSFAHYRILASHTHCFRLEHLEFRSIQFIRPYPSLSLWSRRWRQRLKSIHYTSFKFKPLSTQAMYIEFILFLLPWDREGNMMTVLVEGRNSIVIHVLSRLHLFRCGCW